uniref:Protein quiver n=1 Tax=Ascaris lumbricoides TaxID=6252 RepID=A0A0M3I2L2_ASCLU
MIANYETAQILIIYMTAAAGITCYECFSTAGKECKFTSSTCSYGFFGCIKIAIYSGGVDKFGNYYDQESRIITMNRGCTVLPLGGVDACQQQSLLGYRIVTCYCFTDFCNGSTRSLHVSLKKSILLTSIFLLYRFV